MPRTARYVATTITGVLAGVVWVGVASGHEGEHGGGATTSTPASITEGNFYPMGDEGADVFGSAKLIRYEDASELVVHLRGLDRETTYPMHLHEDSCAAMGPHYRHDPQGAPEPPNELWPSSDPDDPKAGVTTDSDGVANGRGSAPWQARPEAASVMVHNQDTGKMVACADLR